MNINILFAIIGGVFIGGAIGFLIACYKHDQTLVSKPGKRLLLHLGLCLCIALGIACIILSFYAKECPNCDVIVKSNYCEECGYQVRESEYLEVVFCSECGANIDKSTKFCGRCGFKVKE